MSDLFWMIAGTLLFFWGLWCGYMIWGPLRRHDHSGMDEDGEKE